MQDQVLAVIRVMLGAPDYDRGAMRLLRRDRQAVPGEPRSGIHVAEYVSGSKYPKPG